jgi:hypothetical protein
MKSRKYVDDMIMRVILEEEKKLLREYSDISASPSEVWDAFIQPWIDVFKIVKLQTQILINNVLLTVRLMSADSARQRRELKTLHDARVSSLVQETESLVGDTHKSFGLALFIMNPGAYVFGRTGMYFSQYGTREIEEFFKESGFEDLPPSATGADPESLELQRIEQSFTKPAGDLLSKIQKLFFESVSVEDSGPPVVPGDEKNIEGLNKAVNSGPLAATFKKMREDLLKNYSETQKFIDALVPQAEFLANIGKVKTEKELVQQISDLESKVRNINPKAEIKGYKNLPKSFEQDLQKLLKDPKARETAKKELEKKKEKDNNMVIDEKLIDQELKKAAWAKTMQSLTSGLAKQLDEIKKQGQDAFIDVDLKKQYKDAATFEQLKGTELFAAYEKVKSSLDRLNSIRA